MSSYTIFTTKITKIIVQSGIYILYTIQLQLGSIPPPKKKNSNKTEKHIRNRGEISRYSTI